MSAHVRTCPHFFVLGEGCARVTTHCVTSAPFRTREVHYVNTLSPQYRLPAQWPSPPPTPVLVRTCADMCGHSADGWAAPIQHSIYTHRKRCGETYEREDTILVGRYLHVCYHPGVTACATITGTALPLSLTLTRSERIWPEQNQSGGATLVLHGLYSDVYWALAD